MVGLASIAIQRMDSGCIQRFHENGVPEGCADSRGKARDEGQGVAAPAARSPWAPSRQGEATVPGGSATEPLHQEIDEGPHLGRWAPVASVHGEHAWQFHRWLIQRQRHGAARPDVAEQEGRLVNQALPSQGGRHQRVAVAGLEVAPDRNGRRAIRLRCP